MDLSVSTTSCCVIIVQFVSNVDNFSCIILIGFVTNIGPTWDMFIYIINTIFSINYGLKVISA